MHQNACLSNPSSGLERRTATFIHFSLGETRWRTLLLALIALTSWHGALAASPAITSFSPASAVAGETLTLQGSGFTSATEVWFSDWRRGQVPAQFTVASDSELRVTVPGFRADWSNNYATRITVLGPSGATVTLPRDITVIAAGQSVTAGGGASYLVTNGGALSTGGAGGVLMYLEGGAAAEIGGGGGHTVYMEEQAVLNLGDSNGSGHLIVREPSAVIRTNNGTVPVATEVPALTASLLTALPRVLPVPAITSTSIASGKVGESFLYTISTDEISTSGLRFGATGLPAGLTVNESNGLISGAPQVAGVFDVTLSVSNANGTGTLVLTLSVGTSLAPVITSGRVLLARSGQAVSFAIQASNAPESFTASGLPEGITVDATTGALSGAPVASGIYPVTVSAVNSHGSGNATLMLLVDRVQPGITGFSRASAVRGERVRIFGEGFTGATHVYLTSWTGQLVPAPLTVESDTVLEVEMPDMRTHPFDKYESRILLITPAGATITVPPRFQEVRSAVTPSALTFYLVKNGGSLAGGGSGGVVGYLERGATAVVSGGGGHTYYVDAGGSVNVGGGGGGHAVIHAQGATIAGAPATLLQVASLQPSFPPALLQVPPIPTIVGELSATGRVGSAFSYQIRVEFPEPGLTFAAIGLPAGLTTGSTTGLISGTPQSAGTYDVQLRASNGNGTATAAFKLVVSDPQIPIISTRGSFPVELGRAFSLQVAASYSPTSYAATGLPAGLTIESATGLISGSASAEGTFPVTLSATNANGTGSAEITLLVGRRPPRVTDLPARASTGSTIDIRGEGFSGTSTVYFTDRMDAWLAATFTVESDTLLRVQVPSFMPRFDNSTRVMIFTPAGATVTIPADFVAVTDSTTGSYGPFYVVENGGSLGGGGSGGVVAYLKTGASASTGGGGGHTYFVEAGATLNTSGGGGHRIVAAAGANVVGSSSTPVPAVNPSYVGALMQIAPVPGITSARSAAASLGLPFIYTASASNNPASFSADGLPAGLSINASNGIISGRPSGGEGVHEVILSASNSAGTGSATLLVTVRDDYQHWKKGAFASLQGGASNPAAQDRADADQDGVPNVVEFSAGLDPLRSQPGKWPLEPVVMTNGLHVRYRRLKGDGTGSTEAGYRLGTVTYTLEASADLMTWDTGPGHFAQAAAANDNGDGTETVLVRLSSPTARFVRLQITHAAP